MSDNQSYLSALVTPYRLYALHVTAARPLDSIIELTRDDGSELNPGPIDPTNEAWKARVVETLLSGSEDLQEDVVALDPDTIPRGTSEAEALRRRRERSLWHEGDPSGGLSLVVFDDRVEIRMSPRMFGAERAIEEAWEYLTRLNQEFGTHSFDPQLDRIVALDGDRDAVLRRFQEAHPHRPGRVERALERLATWLEGLGAS